MDDEATAPDPCPDAPLVQPEGMTDAMFAQWASVRSMSCPEVPQVRAFFDRATGERLSDEEILRRVFNGSRVEVVPLPGAAWLLLAGLGVLVAMRGRG